MLVYATVDDLDGSDYLDGQSAPSNAGRLLRTASGMVRDATVTAIYATDETGAPTDPVIAAAFRDAVCAQVGAWVLAGVDPAVGAGGKGEGAAEKRIGNAAVRYEPGRVTARHRLAAELCDEAVRILRGEGLGAGRGGPFVTG